jgi:hypothetical protein
MFVSSDYSPIVLISFCPEKTETTVVQGCTTIFKGDKPLKMKESGNRIF